MVATGHRVSFRCDGEAVDLECEPGESLLTVLRERLGIASVKDGCAPQGQCGCCTVLVDGEPRVACVTPVERVAGRSVTTLEGVDALVRDRLVDAFVATGASQCGFCTPGILVRAASLIARGKDRRADVDRALAAHLCRCTGWQTIYEAIDLAARDAVPPSTGRRFDAAAQRAQLEGGVAQRVGADVPCGSAGFADDTAPRDALVAVPTAHGEWIVAESLAEARERAGKVQGRRTTVDERPPLPLPPRPDGGVRLATSWVEPAYLEPDASWCEPGGEPASPLANGGAFGGKERSVAPRVARELADKHGRAVRVVYSREDCVRLGPKRPPIAATAVYRDGHVLMEGSIIGGHWDTSDAFVPPYRISMRSDWKEAHAIGPRLDRMRAPGLGERAALLEGALMEAGVSRREIVRDERVGSVVLDTASGAGADTDALAGARVVLGATGAIERVEVCVAAGDPLDEVVLHSYCIGAAHMALGWVCTEGLAVEPDTGDVLDLTIRSFGVIRPARTPPIDVTILDDPLPPQARASDAVFAAVAAATWNAITAFEGIRPEVWPARETTAARALRR